MKVNKMTKSELLRRIEALEQENKQRGIGNQFMTLKCIQGNRHFTKDATYCASKLFDRTVITTNFGSRKGLEVNTNIFGGYKVTDENQTAVFQVIGADVEPEPKLKQLDQSIFNGLDKKWRFAMVSSVGIPFVYDYKPTGKRHFISDKNAQLMINLGKVMRIDEYDYDTTDWQNSLIERESKELTGSDLCRALKNRDEWVLAYVSDENDATAEFHQRPAIVTGATVDGRFKCGEITWRYAIPINNQGQPLTAAEAGL